MLVVILICASTLERLDCTPQTARAVVSMHVQQIGCASPAMAGPLVNVTGVKEDEYARIKCVMR